MNILLTMSLSSSALLLLLIGMEHFRPGLFSQGYRYCILKAALFFLIVPLPAVKDRMQDALFDIFLKDKSADLIFQGTDPTVLYIDGVAYENTAYKVNHILGNVCLGIAGILFIYYIFQYIRSKKHILDTAWECTDCDMLDILKKGMGDMQIVRKVRIYMTDLDISPLTIGIWKPVIVMPEFMDRSMNEMAVYHELCHIRNHDGLIKFLYIVLAGVYWYNPLTYLLGFYLETAAEFACDEIVTKDMDWEQRKKYSGLIIDMACQDNRYRNPVPVPLSGNKKMIKKRIQIIMKEKRKHR